MNLFDFIDFSRNGPVGIPTSIRFPLEIKAYNPPPPVQNYSTSKFEKIITAILHKL
jgi:hypothetical protein